MNFFFFFTHDFSCILVDGLGPRHEKYLKKSKKKRKEKKKVNDQNSNLVRGARNMFHVVLE